MVSGLVRRVAGRLADGSTRTCFQSRRIESDAWRRLRLPQLVLSVGNAAFLCRGPVPYRFRPRLPRGPRYGTAISLDAGVSPPPTARGNGPRLCAEPPPQRHGAASRFGIIRGLCASARPAAGPSDTAALQWMVAEERRGPFRWDSTNETVAPNPDSSPACQAG